MDIDMEEPNIGEEIPPEEWQDACWQVIRSYFYEKGVVRQQLDSFDNFSQITAQQIIDSQPDVELEKEGKWIGRIGTYHSPINALSIQTRTGQRR